MAIFVLHYRVSGELARRAILEGKTRGVDYVLLELALERKRNCKSFNVALNNRIVIVEFILRISRKVVNKVEGLHGFSDIWKTHVSNKAAVKYRSVGGLTDYSEPIEGADEVPHSFHSFQELATPLENIRQTSG